jgi:hypothetical protein
VARHTPLPPPLLDESLAAPPRSLTRAAVDGTVALDPAVAVDLDEAMDLVRALATVPGHPDSRARRPAGRDRPARRDVLPDWTEAWLAVERERFRQIRLNALEELSSALTAPAGSPTPSSRAGRPCAPPRAARAPAAR